MKTKKKVTKGEKTVQDPRKDKTFELYVMWCSLPPIFKGKGEAELRRLGFETPEMMDLVMIATQEEFRKKFTVGKNTLTRWNKKIAQENLVYPGTKDLMKKLWPNAVGAFYLRLLEHGDAQRMRLFAQLGEDWVEKTDVRFDPSAVPLLVLDEGDNEEPI